VSQDTNSHFVTACQCFSVRAIAILNVHNSCIGIVCVITDLCGNGETKRRHAGYDFNKFKRSTGRTNHKISHCTGVPICMYFVVNFNRN